MNDKSEEFKEELVALLEKYDVGIQGEMIFVIGEDKLVLSTKRVAPDGESPEGCDPGTCEGCG